MNKYKFSLICLLFFSVIFVVAFANYYIPLESLKDNARFQVNHLVYMQQILEIKESFIDSIKSIIQNIKYSFTMVPSLLSYFGVFLGPSRLSFITLVMIFFLVPSIFLTYLVYVKVSDRKDNLTFFSALLSISFLLTNVWYCFPTVKGIIDIAALIFFIPLFYYFIKSDFISKISFKHILVVFSLLVLTFIMRRSIAPALFVSVISLFIYEVAVICRTFDKNDKLRSLVKFFNLIVNIVFSSLLFLLAIKLIKPDFFYYIFTGQMFAECRLYLTESHSLFSVVKELYLYINPVYILFLLLGYYSFSKRIKISQNINKAMYVSLLFIVLYVLCFYKLQDLHPENIVPLAFVISIPILEGLNTFVLYFKKRCVQIIVSLLLIFYCFFHFYSFFFVQEKNTVVKHIISKPLYYHVATPEINPENITFLKLYDFLYNEINGKDVRVASLTDTRLFDPDSLIYYAYINEHYDFRKKLEDVFAPSTFGINFHALDLQYIVVQLPWGMQGTSEDVFLSIAIPTSHFAEKRGIYKYYELIHVIDNVDPLYKLYIYKKIADIPFIEFEKIADEFIKIKPSLENLIKKQLEEYKKVY